MANSRPYMWECPVCMCSPEEHESEPVAMPHVLSCGHGVCRNCINRLPEKRCPTCKIPFSENVVNYDLCNFLGIFDHVNVTKLVTLELVYYKRYLLTVRANDPRADLAHACIAYCDPGREETASFQCAMVILPNSKTGNSFKFLLRPSISMGYLGLAEFDTYFNTTSNPECAAIFTAKVHSDEGDLPTYTISCIQPSTKTPLRLGCASFLGAHRAASFPDNDKYIRDTAWTISVHGVLTHPDLTDVDFVRSVRNVQQV